MSEPTPIRPPEGSEASSPLHLSAAIDTPAMRELKRLCVEEWRRQQQERRAA